MDKDCPCRLWTVTLVTSGCLLMGSCPCVSDPYQQLHGQPEFWVSTSPHQHTDRQLALCILLPDLSAALPSLWESVWVQSWEAALMWGCVWFQLALPATLLWLHRLHWGFSLLSISFFSSHLSWGGRKRKMCWVYSSCCSALPFSPVSIERYSNAKFVRKHRLQKLPF